MRMSSCGVYWEYRVITDAPLLLVGTYKCFLPAIVAGTRKETALRVSRVLLGAYLCHYRNRRCANTGPERSASQHLRASLCHRGSRCLASSCPEAAQTALRASFCHPVVPNERKTQFDSGLARHAPLHFAALSCRGCTQCLAENRLEVAR